MHFTKVQTDMLRPDFGTAEPVHVAALQQDILCRPQGHH